jgi:hypothetical protein
MRSNSTYSRIRKTPCFTRLGQAQFDPRGKGVRAGGLVGVLLVLQEPSFEDRLRREALVRLDSCV